MEEQERHCQDSPRRHCKRCLAATSTTPCQTQDWLVADSGPSTDATPTDRTARSETRCNTGPTHQEAAHPAVAHHLLTVYSRQRGDADQEATVTHRTQQHGSTPLRWTDGQYPTSLHLLETHQDVIALDPTVDSRVSTHLHLTLRSAHQART